jgi:hypothetical protein
MDRFQDTLKTDLAEEQRVEIAKLVVVEVQESKKKEGKKSQSKAMDMTKYDWCRVEFADGRDERALKGPCQGSHVPQGFGRGSYSGANRHGLWLTCEKCQLRLLYVPTHGAKAIYRSAGPLGQDVAHRLQKSTDSGLSSHQLVTKQLGLDAAEDSALRRVEQIRQEKAAMAKAKASTSVASGTTPVAKVPPKKEAKRSNDVPAEIQEAASHPIVVPDDELSKDWTMPTP